MYELTLCFRDKDYRPIRSEAYIDQSKESILKHFDLIFNTVRSNIFSILFDIHNVSHFNVTFKIEDFDRLQSVLGYFLVNTRFRISEDYPEFILHSFYGNKDLKSFFSHNVPYTFLEFFKSGYVADKDLKTRINQGTVDQVISLIRIIVTDLEDYPPKLTISILNHIRSDHKVLNEYIEEITKSLRAKDKPKNYFFD